MEANQENILDLQMLIFLKHIWENIPEEERIGHHPKVPLTRGSHRSCSRCPNEISDYGHNLCYECAKFDPESPECAYHAHMYQDELINLIQCLAEYLGNVSFRDEFDVESDFFKYPSNKLTSLKMAIAERLNVDITMLKRPLIRGCNAPRCRICDDNVSDHGHEYCYECAKQYKDSESWAYHQESFAKELQMLIDVIIKKYMEIF